MPDHYFTTPADDGARHEVDVPLLGIERHLVTAPGVFSHGGLDKATDVLLRHVPLPTGPQRLLDLGCGWGPVACTLALAAPEAEVWAVDVNDRALELTRENAERLGVTVHAARPEDVPADLAFDALWSNPPIRIGKDALQELLLHWLDRLTRDGRAHLVVGRNLGADSLQRWLQEQGRPTERVASSKGFRVLTARPA